MNDNFLEDEVLLEETGNLAAFFAVGGSDIALLVPALTNFTAQSITNCNMTKLMIRIDDSEYSICVNEEKQLIAVYGAVGQLNSIEVTFKVRGTRMFFESHYACLGVASVIYDHLASESGEFIASNYQNPLYGSKAAHLDQYFCVGDIYASAICGEMRNIEEEYSYNMLVEALQYFNLKAIELKIFSSLDRVITRLYLIEKDESIEFVPTNQGELRATNALFRVDIADDLNVVIWQKQEKIDAFRCEPGRDKKLFSLTPASIARVVVALEKKI